MSYGAIPPLHESYRSKYEVLFLSLYFCLRQITIFRTSISIMACYAKLSRYGIFFFTLSQFDLSRNFNPLKTKRGLLYLKTQFVPRSKHFSSRL